MGSLWNRSGLVERYADDLRAAGAKAYFFSGGTTTPLVVFRDSGEASAHPNPVVADANGRWPDVFVPYIVSFDVQVKTADDVQLTYSLQIPNPDPVDLTVTIPATEKVQTGMIHAELVNTTKPGYVRLNGRTIGNASSAGSERANADTSDLFGYLYNNLSDAIAPVLPGPRSGVAATDFAANMTITLPSWQGVGPVGLDDMGAAAGSFFTGLSFGVGNATTSGSLTGSNGVALDITNMPAHTHSGSTSNDGFVLTNKATGIQSVDHTHSGTTNAGTAHSHNVYIRDPKHAHTVGAVSTLGSGTLTPFSPQAASTTTSAEYTGVHANADPTHVADPENKSLALDDKTATESAHTHTFTSGTQSVSHTHNFSITAAESLHGHTFTTDSKGSGVAFNNLGRSRLVTWFIKL